MVERLMNTGGRARFVLYRAVPLIAALVVVAGCATQPVTQVSGLGLEGLASILLSAGIFISGFMGHNLG
jgi:hypothetical protein